jgi:O-antigen ligase
MAAGSLVLFEPAPVDVLACGLVLLLPMVGLTRITPAVLSFLCLWLVVTAAQVLAATQSPDVAGAAAHTLISLQLALGAFVIAAFIADVPMRHTRIVLGGTVCAALVASLAAIVGYFGLIEGAAELLTRHERASGTFKDPNVLGAFLVLPLLCLLHRAAHGSTRQVIVALAVAVPILLAILLTFSRGAWLNLGLAVLVWGALTLTSMPPSRRLRLAAMTIPAVLGFGILLTAVLQMDDVARLIELRASLSQSYDQGPDGRFGGQLKALALIAENPLGIGSLAFVPLHHHEEAHNVYLSMALYAGWIGGGVYLLLVVLTIGLGIARLADANRLRPYLALALSAFLATALEGLIIDSDHWRHFYLQMALVWGLAASPARD